MIKKHYITFAMIIAVMTATGYPTHAQLRLPPASSSQTIVQSLGITSVTLTYHRPNSNGRQVFGDLVPYGEVWRTGANNIPVLTFEGEVTVAGTALAAGTYGLLTIPGKNEWTVIFSRNSNQWGAYSYTSDEDLLRFTVKPERLDKRRETFTMEFSPVGPDHARLNMGWEDIQIGFDLTVDQDAEIMAAIDQAMNGSENKPYFQAAQYYYNNNKDIAKALEWINAADQPSPNPVPYIKYWKARIQLKAGDKQGAIATAEESIAIARQQNNDEYVRLNNQVIDEARH